MLLNVCDFADTMLIVVQINLIWFDRLLYKSYGSTAIINILLFQCGDRL